MQIDVSSLKSIFDYLNLESNKDITGLVSKIEAIIHSDFGKFLSHDGDGLTLSQIREAEFSVLVGIKRGQRPVQAATAHQQHWHR